VLAAAIVSSAAALSAAPARAADFSWSADGQTPAGGGHGAWNTTDLRWHDGSFFMAWPNTTADVANFGGSGSLFVPAAISADRLNFNGDYRLYIPQLGITAAANLSTITLGSGIIDTGANRVEIQNNLAGTSGLTKNGSGMLIVHGSQLGLTGTVNINVNGGTLAYGNTSVADFSTTHIMTVAAGAAIDMGNWTGGGFFTDTVGNIQGAGNIYLGTAQNLGVTVGSALIAGGTGGSVEFSGSISGGGRFSKTGAGTTVFSGANTYTGATSVEGGTLRLVGGNAISDQGAVFLSNVAGVTLQLGSNETIGSIGAGGTTGGVVDIGANTLTVGTDNTFNGFGGNITGTGTVVKAGTGLWAIQNTTPVSAFGGKYRADGGILSFREDVRIGAVPGGPVADAITLNGGILANSSGGGFAMNANRGITTSANSGIAVYGAAASSLSVQGTVTGSHQITKTGIGSLNLVADNGASFSGDWVVRDGGLMTTNNSTSGTAAPFGTGGIDIESANLNVIPTAGTGDMVVNAARGAGETFSWGPGTIVRVDKTATGNSLTLNTGPLVRKPNGTMVVQAAQGAANLGSATGERIIVDGGVATTNGIIPGVFISTSPTATVGDFAGYSGASGMVVATYTSTDLSTSLSSDVVNQTTALTLAGSATAFAVRVGNGAAGTALDLGGNTLGYPSGAFSDPAMLIINTASTIANGTVDFTSRRGMVYAQGAAGAVSATLTGSGGLSKVGAGPLVLATAATYTGDTDINHGTVQLNVNNALPTATNVRLHNSGALNLNGNQQTVASLNSDSMNANINMGVNGQLTVGAGDMRYLGTITNGVSTNSTITKDGAGRLTLGFDLGTVSVESPTLAYNKLVIKNGGVVNVSRTQSMPAASPTSGVALPDTFTLDGGTLRISSINSAAFGSGGASTYTLSGSDTTLRGMTLGAGGGTIEVSEAKEIVLWQRNNAEATGASLINGSGTLHKTGPGFLRLGVGNDNFTGKIVVHGGNLQFQTDQAVAGIGNALGPAPATLVPDQLTLDGGMIQTNGSGVIAANRGITIGAGGGSINNAAAWTFNNPFFGSGPMYVIQGNATGGRVARFANASPSYSGTVNILNGMVDVVQNDALGTGQINLTPHFPIALSKITGAGNALLVNNIVLGTGSTIDIRVDSGVGSLILAGTISGPGGFSKSKIGASSTSAVGGQGTLVLSGGNTFAGDVFVQAGALVVVQDNALGSAAGATIVSPGASLVFEHLHDYTNPEPMWIAGTGVGGAGALINQGGESHTTVPVIAYQDATIGVAGGIDSGFSVGPVRGASHVTKIGAGELSAQHYRVDRLTINEATAAVTQRATSGEFAGTSRVKQLAIAGGVTPTATLDVTNNAFVIDYDAISPLSTVQAQITNAYNGGAWDQPGITSSLANSGQFAVGYGEASALSSIPPAFGTVDSTSVLFRHTRYGDADLDGVVNLNDFNRLAANFGASGAVWTQGDFDYDTNVNLQDFNRLAANFGLAAAGPTVTPQDWAALGQAVPEPTGVGALVLGAVGLLGNRRRRRGG
jgi:autotransporter-associated beta strand protein